MKLGHAAAAKPFGIPTPDITLLPIGGVARLQRMPDKPAQEIVVALPGPAVNVLIVGLLVTVAGAVIDPSQLQHLSDQAAADLANRLATVNVALVAFNLIPAFPMDGGRVLRSLVAMVTTYGRATRHRRRHRTGIRVLVRFARLVHQSHADVHRPLSVFGRFAGSGRGRHEGPCELAVSFRRDGYEVRFAVTVNDWRLVGMITPENVGELIMIRSIKPEYGTLAWRRAL